ncbi:putative oxidoreductase YtbE [compost metagenome]
MNHPVVNDIARSHQASAAQILLAWVVSHKGVMAIPKAATITHVMENAGALAIALSAQELLKLDNAFPAPDHKTALDVV